MSQELLDKYNRSDKPIEDLFSGAEIKHLYAYVRNRSSASKKSLEKAKHDLHEAKSDHRKKECEVRIKRHSQNISEFSELSKKIEAVIPGWFTPKQEAARE